MKKTALFALACVVLMITALGCAGTRVSHKQAQQEQHTAAAPAPESIPAAGSDEPAAGGEQSPDMAQQEDLAEDGPTAAAVDAPAADSAPRTEHRYSGEKISLNFDNADIYEVINALSDFLDINYMIDPAVKGRVNIHTSTEVDRSQLLPIFETIFEMNNIALVKAGDFYKIVPVKEAKQQLMDIHIGRTVGSLDSLDRVIIQVVPLHYVDAREVAKILKPFTGRGGDIISYNKGNLIILVETAGTVNKLLKLINIIDADAFEQTGIRFFKIRNAEVKEISNELQSIFSSLGIDKSTEKGIGLKFIPIERVSCVLAVSSIPGIFERVQHWLDILDTVDSEAEERVFIYFVENGKAEEIADVLSKIYGDGQSSKTTAKKTTARRTKKTQKAAPKTAASAVLEGEIKIVTDESTNSIILRATPHDYAVIKPVLQKLDRIPRQVLIEVLVAEVTLSGDTEFGVEWSMLGDYASIGGNKGQDKVGMDFGSGGLGSDLLTNLGRGLTYRFDSNRLQAFLYAQASKNKLNILSSPHILAAENKEARIEVGKEVPIVTSEYVPQDIEQNTTTSRSIEYRSTGVILSVTPRINEKGLVAMDITQEVSEAQPVTSSGIQSPEISNRKAETSLVVQDGETIVIGGMIKDQSSKTLTGVPILSSVPVLGYLFSNTTDKNEKIELIILITPHVIQTIDEAAVVTRELNRKLKQVKKLLRKSDDYWDQYKDEEDR